MIRAIREEDVEPVIGLWLACGLARPWSDPATDIARTRRDEHAIVLVAAIDGCVAATVMVNEDGRQGALYYVATDPRHRGQGYGRATVNAAEVWLASRGVRSVRARVDEDNVGAQAFYRRLGFREIGLIYFEKDIVR